jgi:hypothetical protein
VLFTHDHYLRDYTGDGGGKAAFAGKPVLLLVAPSGRHHDVAILQWKHRMRPHKVLLNHYPPVDDSVTPYQFMMGSSGLPEGERVAETSGPWDSTRSISTLVVRATKTCAPRRRQSCAYSRLHGRDERDRHRGGGCSGVGQVRKHETYAEAEASSSAIDCAPATSATRIRSKRRRAKVGGYQDYFDDGEVAAIARIHRQDAGPALRILQQHGSRA